MEAVWGQLALLDCSQEGTGDSGWDVPLCPRVYYRERCVGTVARVCNHAGICPEPSLLANILPRRLCSWVLVVSLVLKDWQEDLVLVSVVEHFLLNYHRLYVHVHCIIYMGDRRQHARVGDFQEIQVIRLSFLASSVRINLKDETHY